MLYDDDHGDDFELTKPFIQLRKHFRAKSPLRLSFLFKWNFVVVRTLKHKTHPLNQQLSVQFRGLWV